MEIWKDVVGYENLLMISNKGNLYDKINKKKASIFEIGKGYLAHQIWIGNRKNRKTLLIHRLVC